MFKNVDTCGYNRNRNSQYDHTHDQFDNGPVAAYRDCSCAGSYTGYLRQDQGRVLGQPPRTEPKRPGQSTIWPLKPSL